MVSNSLSGIAAALVCLHASLGWGQNYPIKPIRILTAEPGGGSDEVSRLIAQGISDPLGQQVIVENRPSALNPEIVYKSLADGYTLLVAGGALWLTPLMRQTPYDPLKDFVPITWAATQPNVVAIHPSVPVKSVKELIALAKARPGQLNYGSSGPGTLSHLAGELFKAMTAIDVVRINYKGSGPAVIALMTGEIQVIFGAASSTMPYVKSGRLRALAIANAEPSDLAPGLPTVRASGLPGYEFVTFNAVYAPARTPEALITRLNQEMVRVLKMSETRKRLFNSGIEAVGSSPEELAAIMKADMLRMGKVIKDAGIVATAAPRLKRHPV